MIARAALAFLALCAIVGLVLLALNIAAGNAFNGGVCVLFLALIAGLYLLSTRKGPRDPVPSSNHVHVPPEEPRTPGLSADEERLAEHFGRLPDLYEVLMKAGHCYPLGMHPASTRDRLMIDRIRRMSIFAALVPGETPHDAATAASISFHVQRVVDVEAAELEAKATVLRRWAEHYDGK